MTSDKARQWQLDNPERYKAYQAAYYLEVNKARRKAKREKLKALAKRKRELRGRK